MICFGFVRWFLAAECTLGQSFVVSADAYCPPSWKSRLGVRASTLPRYLFVFCFISLFYTVLPEILFWGICRY